jgi:pentatricopeptide repeat protein
MIAGYVHDGQTQEALEIYHQMILRDLKLDQYIYIALLTLCGDKGIEHHGKQIHAHILRTITRQSLILESTLADFYAKCGRLDDACKVF